MAAWCQITVSRRRRSHILRGVPKEPPTPSGQPKPLDPPMVPFAVVGIALWALAGLALLPFHGWLSRHGHTNWLGICLAGFLLGFVGLAVMLVHDRNRRARRAAERG
jgi:drug/metabolite transporter (DMT)-like permease